MEIDARTVLTVFKPTGFLGNFCLATVHAFPCSVSVHDKQVDI